ncbi:hypothetical protein SPW_5804 [Streptomyces sp. W007]|nr:hypothetical protein SPW_5804 [Streptomyces sp. W007]
MSSTTLRAEAHGVGCGLSGASDAVRLAVLVLASRTPSETGVVEIRTSELGRWIGVSVSYMASDVLPELRRSSVVSVEMAAGDYGQDNGLTCKVQPLWDAQSMLGHPLRLAKKEHVTLKRLMEAVMGPGWKHRDGRVTPAGLIGTRTGRGAATDRLALLLLVLEAQATGRVRLCGGSVDTKRGRAAATLARLMGCTAAAAAGILGRLEDRKLVFRVRLKAASGLANRSRLLVPTVAAAHGRTRSAPVAAWSSSARSPGPEERWSIHHPARVTKRAAPPRSPPTPSRRSPVRGPGRCRQRPGSGDDSAHPRRRPARYPPAEASGTAPTRLPIRPALRLAWPPARPPCPARPPPRRPASSRCTRAWQAIRRSLRGDRPPGRTGRARRGGRTSG